MRRERGGLEKEGPGVFRRLGRRLLGALPTLTLVAMLGSFIGLVVHRDRVERRQWREGEEARLGARQAVFERGALGEMLALCREGWAGELSFHQEPVAVAWSRGGVDGYFHEGVDPTSLRQVRCTVQGVSRGPRVAHPLSAVMPAEAPGPAPEAAGGEWAAALERASSRSLGEDELAFEMLRHPLTGRVLSRSWGSGPEAARAILDPPEGPEFGFLPASAGFRLPSGVATPALEPLPRRHWLVEPEAAFDLLARELPDGAPVAELRLEDHVIAVQIAWPTPAFDGKPPAPYGDKSFDEYGVADLAWWYPREIPGFGCPRGEPLARVRQAFAKERARVGEQTLSMAWFSCSTAYSNGRDGVWHLVPQ